MNTRYPVQGTSLETQIERTKGSIAAAQRQADNAAGPGVEKYWIKVKADAEAKLVGLEAELAATK